MEDKNFSTEDLVSAYIQIRDQIADVKKRADEQVAELTQHLDAISEELQSICKVQGANSISTSKGTVIRTVKSKFWTNDWPSMYDFIRENAAFELLEKRLHQSNMKTFLEENPEAHPPGLNIEREFVVTVRRK
jgi:hypothetical protein